jgi:hypothetical protein
VIRSKHRINHLPPVAVSGGVDWDLKGSKNKKKVGSVNTTVTTTSIPFRLFAKASLTPTLASSEDRSERTFYRERPIQEAWERGYGRLWKVSARSVVVFLATLEKGVGWS